MTRGNSIATRLDGRVAAASLLGFLGLALPFIPVPGDRITPIAVEFRTADMATPASFTASTRTSICVVLAASMAYEDPASGGYTRIDCGRGDTPALVLGAR
jgi:hypothetical protein